MDRFHHSDPISETDTKSVVKYLEEELGDMVGICKRYKVKKLIGSAGAFETFAQLVKDKFKLSDDPSAKPSLNLDLIHFREIASDLLLSDHASRQNNPSIPPVRVDMIIVATLITLYVLDALSISELSLSNYALKEGLFYSVLRDLNQAQ